MKVGMTELKSTVSLTDNNVFCWAHCYLHSYEYSLVHCAEILLHWRRLELLSCSKCNNGNTFSCPKTDIKKILMMSEDEIRLKDCSLSSRCKHVISKQTSGEKKR